MIGGLTTIVPSWERDPASTPSVVQSTDFCPTGRPINHIYHQGNLALKANTYHGGLNREKYAANPQTVDRIFLLRDWDWSVDAAHSYRGTGIGRWT
eukprot:376120-Pyramimonas_sp.AAC.1